MFVYILVESAVIRMVPGVRSIDVSLYLRTFESLEYSGMSAATCWNLLSAHTLMGCISLSVHEIMGLMVRGVLWILIIP